MNTAASWKGFLPRVIDLQLLNILHSACLGSIVIGMVCNTYSLSSLLSPTNASFASSMAQEISLFRKSLQERRFLIKKTYNIIVTLLAANWGRDPSVGPAGVCGTASPGKAQIFYTTKLGKR